MAQILIERAHRLGLDEARRMAALWVEQARERFDLQCEVITGHDGDELRLTRAGLTGTLEVSGQHFRLQAQLGFLLSAFKDRIETEISKNLDELIASQNPP